MSSTADAILDDSQNEEMFHADIVDDEGQEPGYVVEMDLDDILKDLMLDIIKRVLWILDEREYDFDEYQSAPYLTYDCDFPEDMLQLKFSHGFDCSHNCNLILLDEETLLFSAGNWLVTYNMLSKSSFYFRTSHGGGVGGMSIHPTEPIFAVAEQGDQISPSPPIVIYRWPSLKIFKMLQKGTEISYSYVSFSPNGLWLCAQGASPDFMLSVWDWKSEVILLRAKAFSQDIFRATFSPFNIGQLTTGGVSHIRFWKMARTFTGLKLQGELGRFGKTEISDITGHLEMPNGKVVSSSDWGNILLWDGGLIEVEVIKTNGRNCHIGPISQFVLEEGTLLSLGYDGWIKLWDIDAIDTAETSDESNLARIDPLQELQVHQDASLRWMVQSRNESEESTWFVQDAKGGLWKVDLTFTLTSHKPEKLYECHPGEITGLTVAPSLPLLASASTDGLLMVHAYEISQVLDKFRATSGFTALLWPDLKSPHNFLFAGANDGILRSFIFAHTEIGFKLALAQIVRPHQESITALTIKDEILLSGSSDGTVFIFTVKVIEDVVKLIPGAYFEMNIGVTNFCWHPEKQNIILVSGDSGKVNEFVIPDPEEVDNSASFKITLQPNKKFEFVSVRSRLAWLAQKHERDDMKKVLIATQLEEIEKKKKMGLEVEDDLIALKELESTRDEMPTDLFLPNPPNPIIRATYVEEDPTTFIIHLPGYDAGFTYLCAFGSPDPLRVYPIQRSEDVALTTMTYTKDKSVLIVGLENGQLRIISVNKDTPWDWYRYWAYRLSNVIRGRILNIVLSKDEKYLFTSAADSTLFSFYYNQQTSDRSSDEVMQQLSQMPVIDLLTLIGKIEDSDENFMTLEGAKKKSELDKFMKKVEDYKVELRRELNNLKRSFKKQMSRNDELPSYLHVQKSDFPMDPRIREDLHRKIREDVDQVYKQTAWETTRCRLGYENIKSRYFDCIHCDRIQVNSLQSRLSVSSFRTLKRSEEVPARYMFLDNKIKEMEEKEMMTKKMFMESTPTTRKVVFRNKGKDVLEIRISKEYLTSMTNSKDARVRRRYLRLLKKREMREQRNKEWEELYLTKPAENEEDPNDVAAIEVAQKSIGDYKLRTSLIATDNVYEKEKELLQIQDKIYNMKIAFNEKVYRLREKKVKLLEEIHKLHKRATNHQNQIPHASHIPIPDVPTMDVATELPEQRFQVDRAVLESFKNDIGYKFDWGELDSEVVQAFMSTGRRRTTNANLPEKVVNVNRNLRGSFVVRTDDDGIQAVDSAGELVDGSLKSHLPFSPLELEMAEMEQTRQVFQRNYLIKKMSLLTVHFDAEIDELLKERVRLHEEIKEAELYSLLKIEELELLNRNKDGDEALKMNLEEKILVKRQLREKVQEAIQKVENKRIDITKLEDKEKSLVATFQGISSLYPKYSFLLNKIFRRKKKKPRDETSESEESESESSEFSEYDSAGSGDDDESVKKVVYDEDNLPPELTNEHYEGILQLREKRQDVEEILIEERDAYERLKRDESDLRSTLAQAEAEANTSNVAFQDFQRSKQKELNEIQCVASVNLSQCWFPTKEFRLPNDLSQTLVFELSNLDRLRKRLIELEQEKNVEKTKQKENRRRHYQLVEECRRLEGKNTEFKWKCEQTMMSKLGRIIDLDVLDTCIYDRALEEHRMLLEKIRNDNENEDEKMRIRIRNLKSEMSDMTQTSGDKLNLISHLKEERLRLESQLQEYHKLVGVDFHHDDSHALQEIFRLETKVKTEKISLDGLREQISRLKSKSGPLPPLPQLIQSV